MVQRRGHFVGWLLLALFSFGSLLPGIAGRWLLCVGCEDSNFALTQVVGIPAPTVNGCCAGERAPGGDDQRPTEVLLTDKVGGCGCFRVAFDIGGFGFLPLPSPGEGSTVADIGGLAEHPWPLFSPGASERPRGPPDDGWAPTMLTLFGQRTALII